MQTKSPWHGLTCSYLIMFWFLEVKLAFEWSWQTISNRDDSQREAITSVLELRGNLWEMISNLGVIHNGADRWIQVDLDEPSTPLNLMGN